MAYNGWVVRFIWLEYGLQFLGVLVFLSFASLLFLFGLEIGLRASQRTLRAMKQDLYALVSISQKILRKLT